MAMNTEQARDLLAEWARQGQEAAPPAWEELPGIPLYMDQVILYLGESLSCSSGRAAACSPAL